MKLFLSLSLVLMLGLFGCSDEEAPEGSEDEGDGAKVEQTPAEEAAAAAEAEAARTVYNPAQQFEVEFDVQGSDPAKKEILFVVHQSKSDGSESYLLVAQQGENSFGNPTGSRVSSQEYITEKAVPNGPGLKRLNCEEGKTRARVERLSASVAVVNPQGVVETLTQGIDERKGFKEDSATLVSATTSGGGEPRTAVEGYSVKSVTKQGSSVASIVLSKDGSADVTAAVRAGSVEGSNLPLGQYVQLLRDLKKPCPEAPAEPNEAENDEDETDRTSSGAPTAAPEAVPAAATEPAAAPAENEGTPPEEANPVSIVPGNTSTADMAAASLA